MPQPSEALNHHKGIQGDLTQPVNLVLDRHQAHLVPSVKFMRLLPKTHGAGLSGYI